MADAGITRAHLTLLPTDAQQPARSTQPPPEPKQHPRGVWDLPAAAGYRRLAAVGYDGNLLLELNMSERIPESVQRDLKSGVERALEQALNALRI